MTEFFLVVLALLLIYLAWSYVKDKKRKIAREESSSNKTEERHIHDLLQDLKGRSCEIVLREPYGVFDYELKKRVVILDVDDEWVLLNVPKRKTNKQIVARISMIADVREIRS